MDRRAKWFGLALIASAGLAWWRALRRPARDRSQAEPTPRPAPPQLAVVPDRAEPADGADPTGETDPTGQPEPAERGTNVWVEPIDGECPDGYPIKVNQRSGIFHVPGGLSYDRTSPTRCYATAEAAEADGFRPAKR